MALLGLDRWLGLHYSGRNFDGARRCDGYYVGTD